MRGYRYRLYPTPEQAHALAQWAGCARAVYNAGLQQRQVAYRDCGVSLRYNDQGRGLGDLRAALPYLAEPHCDVLQQALRDLDRAYVNFFDGLAASRRGGRAEPPGHPTFRRKHRHDSFRIQNRKAGAITVRRLNRRWGEVRIPKLGHVRLRWSRKPSGEIRHLTVSRDALGWHVSLCCDEQGESHPKPKPAVGLDRGVSVSVADSTGGLHNCPRLRPGEAQRLRRRRRKAGRQETARRHRPNAQRQRSRRHSRTLAAKARLEAREARIRNDFLHKLTTTIAKSHGLVAIEDLRVKHMARSAKGITEKLRVRVAQKRGLNRSILTSGWGELVRQLVYKTAWHGGELVKVPAAYTSQTCAECGHVDAASRRGALFVCTGWGHRAHADTNAARNILAAGQVVTARGALQATVAGATNREPLAGLSHAA